MYSLCLPVLDAGCMKCFAGSGAEEESAGNVEKTKFEIILTLLLIQVK